MPRSTGAPEALPRVPALGRLPSCVGRNERSRIRKLSQSGSYSTRDPASNGTSRHLHSLLRIQKAGCELLAQVGLRNLPTAVFGISSTNANRSRSHQRANCPARAEPDRGADGPATRAASPTCSTCSPRSPSRTRPARRQLTEMSTGMRATSAYWPPLRRRTALQSPSASSVNTSAGSGCSTIHDSSSSSASSCPGAQPA
jgi:hypothetical protein